VTSGVTPEGKAIDPPSCLLVYVVCAFAGKIVNAIDVIKRNTMKVDMTIFDLFSNFFSSLFIKKQVSKNQ
jgi:hypothetical protein